MKKSPHKPVLVREVLDCLQPEAGESYLDVTAGYGGHADAVLAKTREPQLAVLIDRDSAAVEALQRRLGGQGSLIIRQDYLSACRQLAEEVRQFDMILADLGLSSAQLQQPERGFSFGKAGNLDMRMDQTQELTAEKLVNTTSRQRLIEIIRTYGEEPKAAKIASRLVESRPIKDTKQLALVVAKAVRWRKPGRIHPATRTFQAIRIAVNDELSQLEKALPLWLELLAPGGRLAVISFHSLEDRLVKNFLAEHSGGYDAQLTVLTKKPLTASADEIVSNPRARSAKLRAAAKIKTKERTKSKLDAN